MQPTRAFASLALVAALAACAQAPVVQPPAATAAASEAKTVSVGLQLGVASSYGLKLTNSPSPSPGVHRWVAGDVTRYEVELQWQYAPGYFEPLNPSVGASVDVTAGGVGTVRFAALKPGYYYRAVVKAFGRVGGLQGSGNAVWINQAATGDHVDFDFSASNDLPSQVNRTVNVHLDDVVFEGQGGLQFGAPVDGSYAPPAGAPGVQVSMPPTPTPSPSPMPSFFPGPMPSFFVPSPMPTFFMPSPSPTPTDPCYLDPYNCMP